MSESIRVLLVDEDESVLELTETFLQREDGAIDVTAVSSVSEALSIVEGAEFDAVVSDYKMPEMDGVSLASAVRDRQPGVPFFLFTGRSGPELETEIDDADLSGYVQKGAGTEQYAEMAERIREAL